MNPSFWTLQREEKETARDFIFRTWREAHSKLHIQRLCVHREVVTEGYASPYRFARILRIMVGNDDVPVFRVENAGNTIYYAWGEADREGPRIAAFYDPRHRDESLDTRCCRTVDGVLYADLGTGDLAEAVAAYLSAAVQAAADQRLGEQPACSSQTSRLEGKVASHPVTTPTFDIVKVRDTEPDLPDIFALVNTDESGYLIGEIDQVQALIAALDRFTHAPDAADTIDRWDERLGYEWITPGQAARDYGLPRVTITWACRNGRIRGASKVSGRWRFPRIGFLSWKMQYRPRSGASG